MVMKGLSAVDDLRFQDASRPSVSDLVGRTLCKRMNMSATMIPRYDRTPRPRECTTQLSHEKNLSVKWRKCSHDKNTMVVVMVVMEVETARIF